MPGGEPAVPMGTSAPACFASHGADVQNKLFPSPGEGLAPAQRYLVYPTGGAQGAEDVPRSGGCFGSTLRQSAGIHTHTQLLLGFGFRTGLPNNK